MHLSKTVTIAQGSLVGERLSNYLVFRGIPYAKPPLGDLRWKAPEKPDPWDGLKYATQFPPKSIQSAPKAAAPAPKPSPPSTPGMADYGKEFYDDPAYDVPESEDCLCLNIWTPDIDRDAKLPVAIWIHGGAFQSGTGSEKEFDGENYCKKGVILVTINYRTGLFGLLCHRELIDESPHHVCGNYSLLDQLAAIHWVKENISAFGGNPENITVFGQSAGGMSTLLLSCSSLSTGLFQQGILQSCGGYKFNFSRLKPMNVAVDRHHQLLRKALGTDDLAVLRKTPAQELFAAVSKASFSAPSSKTGGVPDMVFYPVIDGYIVEHTPDESAELHGFGTRPYIIGSTLHDMGCGLQEPPGETLMARSNQAWAKLHTGGLTWVYRMDRIPLGDNAGAFHSSDLWYMFGTLDRSWRPKDDIDYQLSEQMVTYWTNFMKTGNPNGSSVPNWPAWENTAPSVRILTGLDQTTPL